MTSLLIYGGSFDPPHLGHLNTARNVQHYFHFDQFVFLPCREPVLKKPTSVEASGRFDMLKLMLKDYPEFSINTLEIDRKTKSYMTDTLKMLRDKVGSSTSITLLLGMDAFLTLPHWHQVQDIPTLCNVLVIQRKGTSEERGAKSLEALFKKCTHPLDILNKPHGQLLYFDAGQYPMSSTNIRQKIQSHQKVDDSLSQDVEDYIKTHGLYTRES